MLRNVEHSEQEAAPSATLSLDVDTYARSGHPGGRHPHLVTFAGPCTPGTIPGVGGGDVSEGAAQRLTCANVFTWFYHLPLSTLYAVTLRVMETNRTKTQMYSLEKCRQ